MSVNTPQKTSASGYRIYTEEDLETLQQILIFKELGFTLKEIKKIIQNPAFNQEEALLLQRKMLSEERNRIERMINTIDKVIKHMKGEIKMTTEEKFEGLRFDNNPYEEEARQRWGNQAVDEANARLKKMTQDEQKALSERWDMIFKKLAGLRSQSPASPEVQAAIKEWYEFLNNSFASYSPEAFSGLGQLYITDERFTRSIDQYGEGLAQLLSEAMRIFADNMLKESSKNKK